MGILHRLALKSRGGDGLRILLYWGLLEAMTSIQFVGNNGTLCFLQELLLLCVILQLLSFSRYFLSCVFINPFQAVSDGSHYREVRFAVDSGLVNTICRLHTSLQ